MLLVDIQTSIKESQEILDKIRSEIIEAYKERDKILDEVSMQREAKKRLEFEKGESESKMMKNI